MTPPPDRKDSEAQGRERRYFPRVSYRAYADLVTTNKKWPVHILDISFNGVLVANLSEYHVEKGEEVIITIESEHREPIKMQGKIAHTRGHYLGIECRASNIDHQQRLRELVSRGPEDPMLRSAQQLFSPPTK